MPNRILREGILTSERVNSLAAEAELFYRRLMSVVDDFGRFHAHASLLRAALYPLKLDAVSDATMDRLLAEVGRAGLVRVYEVCGKRYLELLEFRQQVRAKESKYPPPPGNAPAPAEQMPGTRAASAHLDGGGGEGESEVVFEGGGGGASASPPEARTPPPASGNAGMEPQASAAPPLHVQIALRLREAGVNITSAHPHAHAWAARGLSIEQALEAVALARQRKPAGSIAANYLAPIIEEMLNPPLARGAAGPPAWWASEAATIGKGRELGVQPRPGEAMAEYRARLSQAIAQGPPARAAPPARIAA